MAIVVAENTIISTTGIVPVEQGGTGHSTKTAALNALLPSQTGNSGKVLSTDGAAVQWVTPAAGGGSGTGSVTSISIEGGTTGLTFAGSPVTSAGTVVMSGTLAIAHGGTGKTSFTSGYITSDGTELLSSSTIAGSAVDGNISGNSANVTGVVAVENGGTGVSSFNGRYIVHEYGMITATDTIDGQHVTGDIAGTAVNVTGVVAVENGGTGSNDRAIAFNNLAPEQFDTEGSVLTSVGGQATWAPVIPGITFNTTAHTVSAMNAGDQVTETVAIAKAYTLLKIQTSHPAWIRIYVSSTDRTNDESRSISQDPISVNGLIAETITTDGNLTAVFAPGLTGFNNDVPMSSDLHMTVTNTGSTRVEALTVTLTYLKLVA
jgi:hypothetical protein